MGAQARGLNGPADALIAVGSTGAFRGISPAYALYRRISHMLSDVSATSIIQLSLGLLALIFVGWLAVWQVRRRLTRPDETSGAGFTLSDLRQLHKSGQMTDAEFERAKAKVVEAARRATERDQARAGNALGQRDVQGAVVVGHSMGFAVATALAERASQLVDRLVNIDEGPTEDSCSVPFVAKLAGRACSCEIRAGLLEAT